MPPPPPALVAAVRSAALREGLPLVSLRSAGTVPNLLVVVRLDHPVRELRHGVLAPVLHVLATHSASTTWQLVAVDRAGTRLRLEAGSARGGEAWIRPDLDGCDPTFVIVGRPFTLPFGSDPRCAGDPAADPGHPVGVGGAIVGHAFPLTLATSGARVLAQVNGVDYSSRPGLYPAAPVGQAVLQPDGALVVSLAGASVLLTHT